MAETTSERIAALLRESRAAHDRAKTARHHKRQAEAVSELTRARDLRLEALGLDPERTDPTWGSETPAHGPMMAFYAMMLGQE